MSDELMNRFDQNPCNISHWKLAKRFVEKNPSLVKKYSKLAGINVDIFALMTPRGLCEQYRETKRETNEQRSKNRTT